MDCAGRTCEIIGACTRNKKKNVVNCIRTKANKNILFNFDPYLECAELSSKGKFLIINIGPMPNLLIKIVTVFFIDLIACLDPFVVKRTTDYPPGELFDRFCKFLPIDLDPT